jgi:hypothetical protein
MNRAGDCRPPEPSRRRERATYHLALAAALVLSSLFGPGTRNAKAQQAPANNAWSSNTGSGESHPDRLAAGATGAVDDLAVHLALESPRGCGSLAMYVDRLRARLVGLRVVQDGANRNVHARITSSTDGTFRATMTLRFPDGHSSSRIVDATSCSDAIEALALITAITLDPMSSSPDLGTEAVPNATAEPRTATDPKAQRPKPTVAEPRSSDTLASADQPANMVRDSSARTLLGLGASLATFRGPSPGWLNGLEVYARVMHNGQALLSPSMRLGLSYSGRPSYVAEGGVANFTLASATIDLCPVQKLWPLVELRSCALFHAGIVTAEGRATIAPQKQRRPFAAAGAVFEFVLLPSKSIVVPLRFFGALPTMRDTYAFDPAAFYRVPEVSLGATAGLEIRFR